MRLKISHTTNYVYGAPVLYSLQRLRLVPTNGPTQTVLSWKTSVEGADIEVDFDDQFGNRTELVSTIGAQHTVKIQAHGEVETEDTGGVYGRHTGLAPLWLFKRETSLTKPGKHIRELIGPLSREKGLDQVHALMETISDRLTFTIGATHTHTTAEEALEQTTGVCQDYAHIFVSAARLMGYPARYISGYLLLEDTDEQVASHAWAETYVDDIGWVGFDPANRVCPHRHYVRVACGLDYRDAAPITGMVAGMSDEKMSVSIKVEQQSQSQS